MTEQMNVPKLRFGEFDTQWKPMPLGDITSYLKGFAFKSEDYLSSGHADSRLIRVSDLSSESVKIDNQKVFLPQELMESSTKYKLKDDDVLITTVGSKPELRESAVGRAIYINKAHGYLNQNLLIMRPKGEHLPKFIFSQLNTPRYINHITNIQRGNANQSNITVVDLFEYRVSTTSLPEQQKIVSFLSKVDEKITLLTEKKNKLTEYKKGVMQQLFNGSFQEQDGQLTFIPPTLRFKADDGSEFPDWEERKLGELGQFKNGLNKGKEDFGFGSPFVNLQDVFGKQVISSTSNLGLVNASDKDIDLYQLLKGDVIFIRSSVKKSGVGETALVEKNLVKTVYSGFLIRFRSNTDLTDNYKKYCFWEKRFRNKLIAMSTTSANTNINQESLSQLTIPCPSQDEQTKIANFLSSIDQKIDLVSSELEKTKEWKKGLLQQMFV